MVCGMANPLYYTLIFCTGQVHKWLPPREISLAKFWRVTCDWFAVDHRVYYRNCPLTSIVRKVLVKLLHGCNKQRQTDWKIKML